MTKLVKLFGGPTLAAERELKDRVFALPDDQHSLVIPWMDSYDGRVKEAVYASSPMRNLLEPDQPLFVLVNDGRGMVTQ